MTETKLGRPTKYENPLVLMSIRITKDQAEWLRACDNASAKVRELIEKEMKQ